MLSAIGVIVRAFVSILACLLLPKAPRLTFDPSGEVKMRFLDVAFFALIHSHFYAECVVIS